MNTLAFEIATSFADMALRAIDAGGGDDTDRCETTLRRGRARIKAGDLERGVADCRAALELATRLHLGHLRAGAVLGWAEAAPVWGRQPELRAAIDHLLSEGVADIGARAQLKARLAQLLYYDDPDQRRAQLTREAIDEAQHSEQPETLAAVLATTHAALWDPAELDERTAVATEIVATARLAGQPELEAQGLGWLAVDLLEAGDWRGADEAFAQHRQLAQRLHLRLAERDVELWTAMRAMLHGQFVDARACIERARDLGEAAHDPGTDTVYWVQRYWLAVEQGDPTELDAVVGPCERLADHNTDVPAWRAALAMLHVRRSDFDAAQPHYDALSADDFRAIPRDVVWLNALTYLAETCAALGDARRAPVLLAALAPYADRIALIDRGLACKGTVSRHLGLLAWIAGDVDRAIGHLTSALEHHDAMQARPLAEQTRRDLIACRR
jgi:hypothetical protein